MATFFVCVDNAGATFDCTLKRSEAVTIVRAAGGGRVVAMDVKVNADNMARLLGDMGGYATRITETFIRSKQK